MKKLLLAVSILLFATPAFSQWGGNKGFINPTMIVPGSDTLPGGCSNKMIYVDTDATSGARLFLCEDGTWVTVGGGSGTSLTGSVTHTIGDGTSGDVTLNFDGDAGTDGSLVWDVSEDAFVFSNVVKFLSTASPTVNTAADWAFDNDWHAASRGAFVYFDGTAVAEVVGVLGGACSTDQIPKKTATGWGCAADATGTGLGTNLSSSTNDLLSDSGTIVMGGTGNTNNEKLTFDFETTANKVEVTSSTGVTILDFSDFTIMGAAFEAAANATPTVSFYDSDTTDGDLNASIVVNATATGSGAEVVDMTLSTQIGGAMTAFITRDGSVPSTTIADLVATNASLTTPTVATSLTGSYLTASEILITDADKKIVSAPVATYPSLTELSYVKGVTSAIQTQFKITRTIIIKLGAEGATIGTGNSRSCIVIPVELNGMNLVSVGSHVYTVSTSGTPTYQIRNQTDTADMLSTSITIDANEKDTATAATAAVINTATDDVVTGDEICVDKDVAGTGEKGDEIRLGFKLP